MLAQVAIIALFGSTMMLTMIALKQSPHFTMLTADPPGSWGRVMRWGWAVWALSLAMIAVVAVKVIQP
jgi:hypothetical protein